MSTKFLHILTIGMILLSILVPSQAEAQCTNSMLHPILPISVGESEDTIIISTCSTREQYSIITDITADYAYVLDISGGGFITVYQDGTLLDDGLSPMGLVALTSSDLEVHWHLNPDCDTSASCDTTRVGCITCGLPPGPENDDICSATPIQVLSSWIGEEYDNILATDSPESDPSCANYEGEDVWFALMVPPSGEFTIEGRAGSIIDGGMSMYTSSDNTCSGTLTEIACDDDNGPGFQPKIEMQGMMPGTIVFIRYWEFGGGIQGTFKIGAYSCQAPTNIQHAMFPPARCLIYWDPIPNVTKYDVLYRVKGTEEWERATTVDNSRNLHYLSPNTVYQYKVRAYCGQWGYENISSIIEFNTANGPIGTGVPFDERQAHTDSSEDENMLGIAPNPARDIISVNFATATPSDVQLTIQDVSGRILYQNIVENVVGNATETIDVSTFGQGYYILTMQTGNKRWVRKFVTL